MGPLSNREDIQPVVQFQQNARTSVPQHLVGRKAVEDDFSFIDDNMRPHRVVAPSGWRRRWPSGKVSSSGPEGLRLETRFTKDPPAGAVRKFEEGSASSGVVLVI
ncbi:hypothetical protein AVEN_41743-1 [Araneus ventricosus]|uniref:Uncharacterized protein n=1 Tax=Araneus ventricosus TaxID=182803 RepID=A0A4Y2AC85_ARAVE|nr:hypothetical protein AVEN_41743-1 [Araneus ventricosus]